MRARLTILTLLLGFVFGIVGSAEAATNKIIITWRAGSYAPSNYTGKLLPSSKTMVAVAASVFSNGKQIPLEKQLVRWYVNDTLMENGVGKTTLLTISPEIPRGDFTVRVEFPNLAGNETVREIKIPSVQPHLTLRPETAISAVRTLPLILRSEPYYFNITEPSQLIYNWKVDGMQVPATENPFWLRISPSENSNSAPNNIRIQLTARQGDSILERASIDTQLTPGRGE